MFRYLAFIWDERNPSKQEAARELIDRALSDNSTWQVQTATNGLCVLCAGLQDGASRAYPLKGNGGVVLGVLFERNETVDDQASRHAQLGELESANIVRTKGRLLVEEYWGRYVAFLREDDGRRKWVLRDPTGALPCYHTRVAGVTLFFSNIVECVELGIAQFTVNWDWLVFRTGVGFGPHGQTGLQHTFETNGGDCVEVCAESEKTSAYWNAAAIPRSEMIDQIDVARDALRHVVQSCIASWASCYGSILHELSGGLDSSIVLSCLSRARAAPRLSAVTFYMSRGPSDEREYARAAAVSSGCTHIERARDPSSLDFSHVLKSYPTVNPSSLLLSEIELADVELQLAAGSHAGAITTGIGGDNQFGAITAAYMAQDFVSMRGYRRGLFDAIWNTAWVSGNSVWRVAYEAIGCGKASRRNDIRNPLIELLATRKLLSEEAVLAIRHGVCAPPPWHSQLRRLPPGTARLVRAITTSQSFYSSMHSARLKYPEPVHPLLSQPITELCLQIPSFFHNEAGLSRGLARTAFAHHVPEQVLRREWKDHGVGFAQQASKVNARFVREFLLDGFMVKHGLLDKQRLEAAVRSLLDEHTSQASSGELRSYVVVEAWLRHWTRPAVIARPGWKVRMRDVAHGYSGDRVALRLTTP